MERTILILNHKETPLKNCMFVTILVAFVQCKVHDTNCFPKVAQLSTRTVYDSSDLVGDYELQILALMQKFYIEMRSKKARC